ncbi:TetR/AcrR family transcriptional regulator [Streptomyces sp. NBC_00121]|uniref:TetR/AcrR family transcriptional regulator n=1 Tax=unclassified Streptomyces TaxID=2593676 RepID=UPI0028C3B638|nr:MULTISPECIES: TetR/AcrR family transcriptional regulator [unclassified Streptomyces]WNO69285.1 TetR/AcrR family transcriptional regulator [Streptomyces sp. AM2-3-1]WSC74068.1 TetR/AcrR family transcriptional regulator [Streptomyces sp. NBC_01760]
MARPRSFDEKQVLQDAREQFWNQGYSATSMEDLMSATGLGKGSLYGAFGDKRQLFLRTLDDYRNEQLDSVRQILTGPGSGLERLGRLLDGAADGYANDARRRGCFLANSTSELHGQESEVVSRARATYQEIQDLLAACAKDAQREGDLATDADPQEVGNLLLAVLQGIEFLAKTGMDASALVQIGRSALLNLPRP